MKINLKSKTIPALFFICALFSSCSKKQNTAEDYIGSGDVILFDNAKYNLKWSSHPSGNYYKQEYLMENDSLEKFKKLILLEVLTDTDLKSAVDVKVAELKKMKETDPMVNYDLFEKNGEVMLDFILGKDIPNENLSIVERNVYRYKPFTDNSGKTGVILFGISERAYGDSISDFLISLKGKRFDVPNAVGAFVIPEIKIKPAK